MFSRWRQISNSNRIRNICRNGARSEADLAQCGALALPPPFLFLWLLVQIFSTPPCYVALMMVNVTPSNLSHPKPVFFALALNVNNGTYSQSFAPNCLRGEQIGALFNSHSFCTVVVDVESLEDLCGRKKGQLCSAIAFGSSLGALQRRIHVNLTRSQQEQRIFEETFTD